MKTILVPLRFNRDAAPGFFRATVFSLFGLASLSSLSASPAAAPKTHTLFMGADVAIERDHKLYPIRDVAGGAFVIERNGAPERVPVKQEGVSLRVDLALKLTEVSADVSGLAAERAYSPARDPYRKFRRQNPGDSGEAKAALAFGPVNQSYIDRATGGVAGITDESPNRPSPLVDYERAQLGISSDFNSPSYFAGQLQEELAKQEFDAIDLSFEVSASRPLASPYIVATAVYRGKDDRPGTQRNWIYAQALPPIGTTPQKVRVRQGGFPPGYELQTYQVHLYDRGTEVATTVAPKRVPLTRDEALQYVVMEYVSGHKDATLPPKPAMGHLPADLPARLAQGQFAAPVYVKVTPDGMPEGAFLDSACTRPVDDPYLKGLVGELRFNPALAKGRPVGGVARLKLGDLNLTI